MPTNCEPLASNELLTTEKKIGYTTMAPSNTRAGARNNATAHDLPRRRAPSSTRLSSVRFLRRRLQRLSSAVDVARVTQEIDQRSPDALPGRRAELGRLQV